MSQAIVAFYCVAVSHRVGHGSHHVGHGTSFDLTMSGSGGETSRACLAGVGSDGGCENHCGDCSFFGGRPVSFASYSVFVVLHYAWSSCQMNVAGAEAAAHVLQTGAAPCHPAVIGMTTAVAFA